MATEGEGIVKWLVIGGLVYFGVVDPIRDALSDEEEEEVDTAGTDKAWNTRYWQEIGKKKIRNILVDNKDDKKYLERFAVAVVLINNGFQPWYMDDNETQIETQFKKFSTKIEISFLCYLYQSQYGEDLFVKLREKLSPTELLKITRYVDNLGDLYPKAIK